MTRIRSAQQIIVIGIVTFNVIAYGEFISAKTISGYEEYTIRLDYRDYRKPKYLVIVATASKYGDYFTGGEGSTLYLDEMELTYD